jgi:Uma2 family endonuclease
MGMATTQTYWTVEMLDALPENGNRYEIIDGELFVSPAPRLRHQRAGGILFARLSAHLHLHPLGYAFYAPGTVDVSRNTRVEPDVFVLPPVDGRMPATWREAGCPLLVIEVLSPTTAHLDRVRKRALYQKRGVPEYWIVDLDTRAFERWRPGDERPEILVTRIEWHPGTGHPPFAIELEEYFRAVFDA